MPFLNELVLESVRGSDFYTLSQPLSYQYNDIVYAVPKGFKTDFASIPKALRSLIDDDEGDIRDAAVIHDRLYSTGEVSREEADKILKRAMLDLGSSSLRSTMVYMTVRLFGASRYRQNDQKIVEN